MTDQMTRAVRDDLAKLVYSMCRGLTKDESKDLLRVAFARQRNLSEDMCWALYVRGKSLARKDERRAA